MVAFTILFGSLFLIAYHHAIYPMLLAPYRRRPGCSATTPDLEPSLLPTMTLIVPAHNEEHVIAAKIANIAALDYPPDRLKVIFVFDGCTDTTAQIADRMLSASLPKWDVKQFVHHTNIGKVAVLNTYIQAATSDIVALSDASASVGKDALKRIAAGFEDRSVGVVCGTYAASCTDNAGESAYWRYQTELKAREAAFVCPMGAHGAFYAIRRDLWCELPPDTVNDDFVLPMTIVAKGYNAIYDQSIVARELERGTRRQGFWRRVRIGVGNAQQVARLLRLADPRRPRLAFVFLSGKMLRAALPFLLAAMTLSAFAAAQGDVKVIGLMAIALLAIAIAALSESDIVRWRVPAKLRPVAYVASGYLALTVGALVWLSGATESAWRLSRRATPKPSAPEAPERKQTISFSGWFEPL